MQLFFEAELETGLNYTYSFAFGNMATKACIDQMFVHAMKMMCVFACIIDESALPSHLTSNLSMGSTAVTAPPPPTPAMSAAAATVSGGAGGPLSPPQPSHTSISSSNLNTSLLNTSGASSSSNLLTSTSSQHAANLSGHSSSSPGFLKSKFSSLTESKLLSKNQSASALGTPSTSGMSTPTTSASSASKDPMSPRKNLEEPAQPPQQPHPLPKTSSSVYLGYFQKSSHYLKLYESLKVLFNLYKKSSSIGKRDSIYIKNKL
jgi:hypothetical protein